MAWTLDTLSTENSVFSSISNDWDDFSIIWSSVSLSNESSLESVFLAQGIESKLYTYNGMVKSWDSLDSHTWDSLGFFGATKLEPSMTAQQSSVMQGWYWNYIQMLGGNPHWESFLLPWESADMSQDDSSSSSMDTEVSQMPWNIHYNAIDVDWEDYSEDWNLLLTGEEMFHTTIWNTIFIDYLSNIDFLFSEWDLYFRDEYVDILAEGEEDDGVMHQLVNVWDYANVDTPWNSEYVAWGSTIFNDEIPLDNVFETVAIDSFFYYNGTSGDWNSSNNFWNSLAMEIE